MIPGKWKERRRKKRVQNFRRKKKGHDREGKKSDYRSLKRNKRANCNWRMSVLAMRKGKNGTEPVFFLSSMGREMEVQQYGGALQQQQYGIKRGRKSKSQQDLS